MDAVVMLPPALASQSFPPVSDHGFWEQASWPILERVAAGPIGVVELRTWALRKGMTPAFLTHSLKWLEIRGQIMRDRLADDRPAWRARRSPSPPCASIARVPDDAPAEAMSEIHAAKTPEERSPADGSLQTAEAEGAAEAVPHVEWISTKEAASLLEMSTGGVLSAAKRGRIAAIKDGDGGRAPYLLDRASVLAFRRAQLENSDRRRTIGAVTVDGTAAGDPPATLTQAPRITVDDATLLRRLFLLVQCGLEGVLDPGEALTKIRTLLAEHG